MCTAGWSFTMFAVFAVFAESRVDPTVSDITGSGGGTATPSCGDYDFSVSSADASSRRDVSIAGLLDLDVRSLCAAEAVVARVANSAHPLAEFQEDHVVYQDRRYGPHGELIYSARYRIPGLSSLTALNVPRDNITPEIRRMIAERAGAAGILRLHRSPSRRSESRTMRRMMSLSSDFEIRSWVDEPLHPEMAHIQERLALLTDTLICQAQNGRDCYHADRGTNESVRQTRAESFNTRMVKNPTELKALGALLDKSGILEYGVVCEITTPQELARELKNFAVTLDNINNPRPAMSIYRFLSTEDWVPGEVRREADLRNKSLLGNGEDVALEFERGLRNLLPTVFRTENIIASLAGLGTVRFASAVIANRFTQSAAGAVLTGSGVVATKATAVYVSKGLTNLASNNDWHDHDLSFKWIFLEAMAIKGTEKILGRLGQSEWLKNALGIGLTKALRQDVLKTPHFDTWHFATTVFFDATARTLTGKFTPPLINQTSTPAR